MLILIIALLFEHILYSQERLKLSNLIAEAKIRNPDIAAMKNNLLAAKENVKATRFWDYPSIGVEYWFGKEKNLMGSISQMIPFPGKISARVNIARIDEEIAGELLSLKTISVISEVKKAFYMYYLAWKKIEIILENIDLMKQFSAISESLYITGKVPQSDVLKANTEIVRMENMLLMYEAEKKSAIAMLKALIGVTNEREFGIPELEENDLKFYAITNFNINKFPDVKIKEFFTKRSSYNLTLAKLGWFPDFMVGTKFDTMGQAAIMVSSSIPIYFFKQRAEIKKMKYEKEMTEQELIDAKNMFTAKLSDLIFNYKARIDYIKNYKNTIIPLSEQTLKLSESGYRAGKNSFIDLIDSLNRYLNDKIEYYKAFVDAKIIEAEIERISGRR